MCSIMTAYQRFVYNMVPLEKMPIIPLYQILADNMEIPLTPEPTLMAIRKAGGKQKQLH